MNRASLKRWALTSSIEFGRDSSGGSWKTWVNSGNPLALGISLLGSVRIDGSLRRSR